MKFLKFVSQLNLRTRWGFLSVLIAAFALSLAGYQSLVIAGESKAESSKPLVEVWKSPTCGCCGKWIDTLKAAGYPVKIYDEGNAAARAKLGIPTEMGSCHTSRVQGYALEGHVPAREIDRLLKEKPKAVGLAVPGMPQSAPGMNPDSRDPYDVLLVKADGASSVFATYR